MRTGDRALMKQEAIGAGGDALYCNDGNEFRNAQSGAQQPWYR